MDAGMLRLDAGMLRLGLLWRNWPEYQKPDLKGEGATDSMIARLYWGTCQTVLLLSFTALGLWGRGRYSSNPL